MVEFYLRIEKERVAVIPDTRDNLSCSSSLILKTLLDVFIRTTPFWILYPATGDRIDCKAKIFFILPASPTNVDAPQLSRVPISQRGNLFPGLGDSCLLIQRATVPLRKADGCLN